MSKTVALDAEERRRHRRYFFDEIAHLEMEGERLTARVTSMSVRGAFVACDRPPIPGTQGHLVLDGVGAVPVRVTRVAAGGAGVELLVDESIEDSLVDKLMICIDERAA